MEMQSQEYQDHDEEKVRTGNRNEEATDGKEAGGGEGSSASRWMLSGDVTDLGQRVRPKDYTRRKIF